MKNFTTLKQLLGMAVFIFSFLAVPVFAAEPIIHSASEYDYPPFSIVTSSKQVDGFSVELLRESLKKVGLEVDFYVDQWSVIKEDLKNGKIQVLPLVGRTPEREAIYDFTVPYITIPGNIFVRNGSTIRNITDLKDKEVIVMSGDNAEEFVNREKVSDKIIKTKSYEEAFALLAGGKHDAVITQEIVGMELIKKLGLKNVSAVSKIENFKQDYTFAVKEGDTKLLARLNDGLGRVISDGTYDRVYKKWFSKSTDLFGEEINFEKELQDKSKEIGDFLDSIVQDTVTVSGYDFDNLAKTKNELVTFYKSKSKKIWYNLGSDESPIEQSKIIPLYKDICFIDKAGNEKIKYGENGIKTDLVNVADLSNTEYKSETYFADAVKMKEGEVFISNLASDYVFVDDVFKGLDPGWHGKYEKVIARDLMKQGVIRFSSPVYKNKELLGVVVLSLDYRHYQDLIKHVNPGYKEPIISASYAGNYILAFDIDGNTIVHPKPDNVRGYLPDGRLAGYKEDKPKNEGAIFNLFAYTKSMAYSEMADIVLNKKKIYQSSATDVSGRTKLTVASPIIYDNPKTNYRNKGVFGGLMMSISLDEKKPVGKSFEMVRNKALETADMISGYIVSNPPKSVKDLQGDKLFGSMAIQQVGESGYTAVLDAETGVFYFHPQEKLVNTKAELLKDSLPEWWKIISKTIGKECKESYGTYDWIEEDGRKTEKIMYFSCVKNATTDGRKLFVAATAYLDDSEAYRYLDKYEIENGFNFAKDSIKQRALDISKQIELYLKANPQATLEELKKDVEFRKLAVQTIGKTGYTYLVTHNSGQVIFHLDEKVQGSSHNNFKQKFPAIWEILNRSVVPSVCADSDGFYEWADINGKIRNKYTYQHCVEATTKDGFKFFIGASTYLDEYNELSLPKVFDTSIKYNFSKIFTQASLALVFIIIFLFVLSFFKIIKLKEVFIYSLLIFTFSTVSFLFILSSFLNVKNLKSASKDSYIKQHYQYAKLETDRIKDNMNKLGRELSVLSKVEAKNGISSTEIWPYLERVHERNEKYVYAVYRIDKNAVILNMRPEDKKVIGSDLSAQAHMIKIKETLSPTLSNVFDAVEGFKAVTLHYPVLKDGIYDGTVAFLINLDLFFSDLELFEAQIHVHDSFLLDTNLTVITSTQKEYLGKNLSEVAKFKDSQKLFEEIKNSKNLSFEEYGAKEDVQLGIFNPVTINDNTWYLFINSQEENIYDSISNVMGKIWLYTLLALLSLVLVGFIIGYILTRSLRKEIEKRTLEIGEKTELIEEQLVREAGINRENEKLIEEQKKSKKELEGKILELEKFQKMTVNRELKMVELKKRIKELGK